jgi:hypothetical protein
MLLLSCEKNGVDAANHLIYSNLFPNRFGKRTVLQAMAARSYGLLRINVVNYHTNIGLSSITLGMMMWRLFPKSYCRLADILLLSIIFSDSGWFL